MSKKRKRQIRSTSTSVDTRTPVSGIAYRSVKDDFNPNYDPVVKDLRRIAILAGSFLLVMIVLVIFVF